MAFPLGWKDILRPIRDGYRHLFPTPDTGPTPEERRKQRETDRLKGFTYFDTFEQLEQWTEGDSDPLQRPNTPLLPRTRELDGPSKAATLLIHDYSGNYHDYESVQGIGVDEHKYACEYLQYVDSFVYFSHKLVCVPPPTWTNTLHRNGVKALGTILVEPQTEGSEGLLQHTNARSNLVFPMAKKLANIAMHHGFDGWLVNIEKSFPKASWDIDIFDLFLHQLRAELGETMQLIWYDALTISNKISYQNELNASNLRYTEACGNILTNYCWTEAGAERSRAVTSRSKIPPGNVFFGIDVWAQNTSSFTHPRVTYPEYGGGGTNTGVAVAKLAGLGLSAGIFAPAWSFEHFPGRGRDIERTIWEGTALPTELNCSCGDCASRHRPNEDFATIKFAREWAAGSESFFYTDFNRAFGMHRSEENDVFDGHNKHAQLGTQSILPCPLLLNGRSQVITLSYRLEDTLSHAHLVIEAKQTVPTIDPTLQRWLPLYKLDMPANSSLRLEIFCGGTSLPTSSATVSFYLKTTEGVHFVSVPASDGIQPGKITSDVRFRNPRTRLLELGVHLQGSFVTTIGETIPLLKVLEIRIMPKSASQISQLSGSIEETRFEFRGEDGNKHIRLCWSFKSVEGADRKFEGIPYSETTGPFSHFVIRVDGLNIGRAYALEHPLSLKLIARITGKELEVEVIGIAFGGRELARDRVKLRLPPVPVPPSDVFNQNRPRTEAIPLANRSSQ